MAADKKKLITVYNAAEGRAYFLDPKKAGNHVMAQLGLLGCKEPVCNKLVVFNERAQGELPEAYKDLANHIDAPASEAIWAAVKLYGFTTHYSRNIELPKDGAKNSKVASVLQDENVKVELLALDRTGISPVPLEIIFNTVLLYGQIASEDAKKHERAKEALGQFQERVQTYGKVKTELEKAGFHESDQLYRKVRRDYEFLRNVLMQAKASANVISDIKKSANKKVSDTAGQRDNALKPYAELKGKASFRAATGIATFLVGGGAATYMVSIKDELIKYFSNFTAIPMTLFGAAMLAAAAFSVAGITIFDATVRFIENKISSNAARKIAKVSRKEDKSVRLIARRDAIFALEQMAKYHYIEDLERNAPRKFVDMAVHEDWEGMQKAIRNADRYAAGGFMRHIFSTPSTRKLASIRPY